MNERFAVEIRAINQAILTESRLNELWWIDGELHANIAALFACMNRLKFDVDAYLKLDNSEPVLKEQIRTVIAFGAGLVGTYLTVTDDGGAFGDIYEEDVNDPAIEEVRNKLDKYCEALANVVEGGENLLKGGNYILEVDMPEEMLEVILTANAPPEARNE